ncbi:unnamed protein product [Arctia plantaginis]|uniref:Uncharacterized protein n=1 Tax=Arctia plantaginis TaxID=874455 RepID=A0A8S1A527_ARCPL|nr:unnamed protein product [Arctia plantaginis]
MTIFDVSVHNGLKRKTITLNNRVPLFFGRRKCTCGKQAACCGSSDSESDIGPIEPQEIKNDDNSSGVKLMDVVNEVTAVVADEDLSIVDEPEAVEEIFQDSNVNGSESGDAGDASEE